MGWIAETCGRCGRPLKTDKSRDAGYGPVCIRKVEAEEAKRQLEIDEVEGFVLNHNVEKLPFDDIDDLIAEEPGD